MEGREKERWREFDYSALQVALGSSEDAEICPRQPEMIKTFESHTIPDQLSWSPWLCYNKKEAWLRVGGNYISTY